jgi:queuosine precursor transporter
MTKLPLSDEKLRAARLIYISLAALFVAALITCNIIANKFISIDLGFKTFVISVGILPYPITFLITDILSEFYGRRRTNEVVWSGFLVSGFVLFILWLGHVFPAIPDSPVQDAAYNNVFQNSWRIISASMLAYLTAQLVDVRVFHFWKRVTKGKMLWLRNNFSTTFSQLIDTFLVVTVIFIGAKSAAEIGLMVFDGWLFKVICAAGDTLIIYPVAWGFRKYFKISHGEELQI